MAWMARNHPEGAYDMARLEGYSRVVDTVNQLADRPPEVTRELLLQQVMRGFDAQVQGWKVSK